MKKHLLLTLRSIVVIASTLCMSAAALAQVGGNLSREVQANMFSHLWMETCAKFFFDPVALRSAARTFGFLENPTYAQEVLKGEAGTVWDVSAGPDARYMLVLLDNGNCRVLGRRAASQPVNEVFEKVLQGIKTPGVSVERISENEFEQNSVKLKQIVYFLSRTGADQGWAFVATTSDSEAAGIQATISITPTTRPGG